MKENKKRFLSLLTLALLAPACSGNGKTTCPVDVLSTYYSEEDFTLRSTYDNKFGEDKIPGQWTDYGVGDPFVYRFNGKYYLYCSTKNTNKGVRGWVSEDLIHWEKMTGEGLNEGYVSEDECTITAYAPEVIYYNGYFYMVESQGGNGHYVLRSERPEGPFKRITDNFGEAIDGSFFLDDDEQMYLLRASNSGIRLLKIDPDDNWALGGSKTLDNTQLGGWTEGPYLLKRDGIYYMTYTGNSVVSEGYRVGYSYNTNETIFNREGFEEGGTILLSTGSDFKGLGHSSTVLGPNLDSYYIAYHNLNSSGGPNRSFNIDRLNFNGTDMNVSYAGLHDNFAPEKALFSAFDDTELSKEGSFLLSSKATRGIFTAEFNASGDGNKLIFSYANESDYGYLMAQNGKISLHAVKEGKDETLTEIALSKTYDWSKLHTFRVISDGEKIDCYFDNMRKIAGAKASFHEGRIGYQLSANGKAYATSFGAHAFGSSDKAEAYQERVQADDFCASYFGKGSGLATVEKAESDMFFNGKEGTQELVLQNSKDFASYRFMTKEGRYGFGLTLDQHFKGKKVEIQVDGSTRYQMNLGDSNGAEGRFLTLTAGELDLSEGVHTIRVIGCDKPIAFTDFVLYPSRGVSPSFENNLSTYMENGARYITTWKIIDDGHAALSGNRNLLYVGDDTLSDATIEADVKLVGETQANTCGFILRAKNPSFSSIDTYSSVQGYYVGFNNSKVFVSKCDYNNSNLDVAADAHSFASDVYHHVKASIHGNLVTLSIDSGVVELRYADDSAFLNGSFGLYTDGAACIYKNLKISA